MNPVTMTIINPWKKCWPSRASKQGPPVLKSAMLPTELWGSACEREENIPGTRGYHGYRHFVLFVEVFHWQFLGVLCGSVVKSLTCNPGVLGSSHTGSSVFFSKGVSLCKILQSPSLVLLKPCKDMNYVSCRHDMTVIQLKAE